MKITRPLWAQGIFMTPQHFQQQALWDRYTDGSIARMASPEPWGTVRIVLDTQALSIHRLVINALAVRLPDGTVIDTDIADRTPPARDLADVPANVDSVVVRVGLPLVDAQGGNCVEPGDRPPRPRRFMREYLPVADLQGDGKEEISVERHALVLLFDTAAHADYVTCPVARLMRTPQGHFDLDPAFVPPCLFLSASDRLTERMLRLSEILAAKSEPGRAPARALRPDCRLCGSRRRALLAVAQRERDLARACEAGRRTAAAPRAPVWRPVPSGRIAADLFHHGNAAGHSSV